jgi:pimeloyl-ACP methyl ester carboxylesterase
MPTFGGGPAWDEVGRVGEYCIQRNRASGHHRLLDGSNVRRAWGSLEDCEKVLATLVDQPPEPTNPNIPMRTLGGMQFWADEMVLCGWRIQRNVFTGHCRLLDASNRRQAWGTFEQCEVAQRRLHEAAGIEPVSERLVMLVHGVLGWRDRWAPMAVEMRRRGYEPVDVNYPSTRSSIEDHVRQLAGIIENIGEVEQIDFVTHSMGALLVRRLLAEQPEIPVRRIVMIAPPNRGSLTADLVRELFAYHLIFGPAGGQLVTGVKSFAASLPVPDCEFAVIAGGKGDGHGHNPLIPGDDDGVVDVESTKLDGMRDFLVVNRIHSAIIRAPEVISATVQFLESGRLQATQH